jgi:hypothetical protein
LIASNGYTGAANTYDRSVLAGTITLTASKTFELQHRVTTTRATTGFGQPATFGDSEIYSIVKITKVK